MTSAHEYYQDLASLHDLTAPEILSGDPVPVVGPEFRLPVHSVEPEKLADRLDELETNCKDQIGQAAAFLRAVVIADNPRLTATEADGDLPKSVAPHLFANLIPQKLSTGHLGDFQIQAITQTEAPADAITQFDRNARNSLRSEMFYGTAHLLASAELHSGRTLGRVGRVARLAITGRHDESHQLQSLDRTPYLHSYRLTETDWDIQGSMRRGRGRAWWEERRAITNPYSGGRMSGK